MWLVTYGVRVGECDFQKCVVLYFGLYFHPSPKPFSNLHSRSRLLFAFMVPMVLCKMSVCLPGCLHARVGSGVREHGVRHLMGLGPQKKMRENFREILLVWLPVSLLVVSFRSSLLIRWCCPPYQYERHSVSWFFLRLEAVLRSRTCIRAAPRRMYRHRRMHFLCVTASSVPWNEVLIAK